MNEWRLMAILASLLGLALIIVYCSLKKSRNKSFFVLGSFVLIAVVLAYRHWGNWPEWSNFVQNQKRQEAAKRMLATTTPEQLIARLKAQLQARPASPKGWFLLGRIYASQGEWILARDAFQQAYALDKNSEILKIQYIESLWQVNGRSYNAEIRSLLEEVLAKNPEQGDALAMLANDAYLQADYKRAVALWHKLLKLVPKGSREAAAIQSLILQAEKKQ